jgi:hypothetical protein
LKDNHFQYYKDNTCSIEYTLTYVLFSSKILRQNAITRWQGGLHSGNAISTAGLKPMQKLYLPRPLLSLLVPGLQDSVPRYSISEDTYRNRRVNPGLCGTCLTGQVSCKSALSLLKYMPTDAES